MWNDAVVSQYSWSVTFTGVETREVLVGQTIGTLPTIEYFGSGTWTDANGNVYTAGSVPTADLVLTTDANISYTIKGLDGTDLYTGNWLFGDEPSYDAYRVLTKEDTTFIGYLVGDVLYAELTEATMASLDSGESIVTKTITLGIIDGASIRLSNNPSIRFTATVGISDCEYAKVLDFGILMTTDEVRKNLSAFTIEGLSGVDSSLYYNYNKNGGNLRYVENKDYANQYVYSLVLEKISKSNYGVKYTARVYVLVEYADGTQDYVYGEIDEEVALECEMSTVKFEKCMMENKFHMCMYELDSFLRNINKYWTKNFVQDDKDAEARCIINTLHYSKVAMVMLHSVAPNSIENLAKMLGCDESVFVWDRVNEPIYNFIENKENHKPEFIEARFDFFKKHPIQFETANNE